MKNIKLYLSYLFYNGMCYYNVLTSFNDTYTQLDSNYFEEVDKRATNLTPERTDELRIKEYFIDRTKKKIIE